jgi:hypothetical protein
VIVGFVVPAILRGHSPVAVALTGRCQPASTQTRRHKQHHSVA